MLRLLVGCLPASKGVLCIIDTRRMCVERTLLRRRRRSHDAACTYTVCEIVCPRKHHARADTPKHCTLSTRRCCAYICCVVVQKQLMDSAHTWGHAQILTDCREDWRQHKSSVGVEWIWCQSSTLRSLRLEPLQVWQLDCYSHTVITRLRNNGGVPLHLNDISLFMIFNL